MLKEEYYKVFKTAILLFKNRNNTKIHCICFYDSINEKIKINKRLLFIKSITTKKKASAFKNYW